MGTTYNEADVFSRRYGGSSLTQLDRFNRPTDWTWTKDLSTDRNFVDRDIAWDENSNVIRVEDNIHTGRDMAFSNDALNRLIMIEQGTWSGSAITSRTFQELWTLTPTGNWDLYKLDLNGNNTFTDSGDLNDDRTHNKANELTARDTDDNGTDNYTLVHDAAGNLREDGANYKFTYDAFGRLRTVLDANAGDALVAEYWYNGLGYRIAAHQDTDSDGDVDGNDTIVRFIYDERWRVVATYHDSDGSPKSEFIHHNAGLDGLGGGSYIDSVILRDRDASGDPSVMEERVYFCQDWRHDVVAIVSDAGKMLEWVDYTPYGMPYGRPAGDTDSDYDWDATDSAAITGGYDVRKDANLDGVIDSNDVTHANSITGGYQTLGRTVLSSTAVANRKGYAGYERDHSIPVVYHVRHRVLHTTLGRWTRRDPLGYVDGGNVYAYVNAPTRYADPLGTQGEFVPADGDECAKTAIDDCKKKMPGYFDRALESIQTNCPNSSGYCPKWTLKCIAAPSEATKSIQFGRTCASACELSINKDAVSCAALIHEMIHAGDYCSIPRWTRNPVDSPPTPEEAEYWRGCGFPADATGNMDHAALCCMEIRASYYTCCIDPNYRVGQDLNKTDSEEQRRKGCIKNLMDYYGGGQACRGVDVQAMLAKCIPHGGDC